MTLKALIAIFLLLLTATNAQIIAVQFGSNVPPGVQKSILGLVQKSAQFKVQKFDASESPLSSLASGSFLLSFGLTETSRQTLDYAKLKNAGSEALMVQSDLIQGVTRIVGDGNPLDTKAKYSIGSAFASYHILELLGFAFFHPFEPTTPTELKTPKNYSLLDAPRWPFRGTHYHTEHPLEITELLQGMGLNASTSATDQSWEKMLPEMELFSQWLVATRQNSLEWILLCSKSWQSFCASSLREKRLKSILDIIHSYGIQAGADLPIAMKQQNAWYMIQDFGDLKKELAQIETRINWLISVGFDFIATETGYSEFTHPDDTRMLTWMNHTANYAIKKGYQVYIKVHCSTGQYCKDYKDPRDGKPLNFNFLPTLANSSLGVFAHTVQMYTFDDPAPTYGNQNFTYMFDYMMYEASRRPTVYYGETAYWVNYDIDVPLFLPLYGSARLYDLRKAAFKEKEGSRILGQMNFCSGFEWGYWLNEIMTHRAAWNPHVEKKSDSEALHALLQDILPVFGSASDKVIAIIEEIIAAEYQLLVLGQVTGKKKPENIIKHNGIAYLEGWDTWSEIGELSGKMETQPSKYSYLSVKTAIQKTHYHEIAPLLQEMADKFTALTSKLESLRSIVPSYTVPLIEELRDAMNMTALRAIQVNALYKHAAGVTLLFIKNKHKEDLQVSDDAIVKAQAVVAQREKRYRVPWERIAGWRHNPTVYTYGYLWTVHSLFYMRRDHEKATKSTPKVLTPCYMNIINPVVTAFGEGTYSNMAKVAHDVFEKIPGLGLLSDCLVEPKEEPKYDSAFKPSHDEPIDV